MKKLKQLFLAFALIALAVIGHSQTTNTGARVAINQNLQVYQPKTEFTQGFNLGTFFAFIPIKYNKQDDIPKDLLEKINKVVPRKLLKTIRFSGTMSNYMTLSQKGYGENKDLWKIWQMLNGKLSFGDKLKYTSYYFTNNMSGVVNMFSKYIDRSFLYNFVEAYKQLDVREVEFTFNSLSPYLGFIPLSESIESLKFINDNTNLTRLELVNESYFDDRIIMKVNNEQKGYENVKLFTDYLYSIVPEITKVIGKDVPLGLNVANYRSGAKFKGHNIAFTELADKLIADGYKVYLVPHIYFDSYDLVEIEAEIKDLISPFVGKYEIRVTEFNVDPKVKFPNGKKLTQAEYSLFMDNILDIFQKQGVSGAFIHSLWELDDTQFSYIKSK
jgi:hypothetical protein